MDATQPTVGFKAVDTQPVGFYQILVFVICALCLILDGFDVQMIGFVAPAIIKEWGVSRAALGPVFSASLLGMVIGSIGLSSLADRFGRRPMLIASTVFAALGMCATSTANSIDSLLLLRFLTGLGLGGLMPNVLSLTSEYTPTRFRTASVMLMAALFSAGGAVGGIAAGFLLPSVGWRMMFLIGGVGPLILAVVMLFTLPESLEFLSVRGAPREVLEKLLRRLFPKMQIDPSTPLAVEKPKTFKVPLTHLFTDRRAVATLLLWVITFMNLVELYSLSNWLPTVLDQMGIPLKTAVAGGTLLQVGGVVGTILFAILVRKIALRGILLACFLVGSAAIASIGMAIETQPALLLAAITLAGFCIVGGQPALNALAASYYPTELRTTGVGAALGVGRLGSILGPLLGGSMITLHWAAGPLFMVTATPALVAALGMVLLMITYRREPSAS